MVQNIEKPEEKRRGRPRAYDPQKALEQATDIFWKSGYAGTSVDEIAAATGMNKPSLYAAFGGKHDLYMEALNRYWQVTFEETRNALAASDSLEAALVGAFAQALSVYFSGHGSARGCFVVGTAVTEAVDDGDIRNSLQAGFGTLDHAFEQRLRLAQEKGQLSKDADPKSLSLMATATMHTIAIRARAGVSRDELRDFAGKAAKVICG